VASAGCCRKIFLHRPRCIIASGNGRATSIGSINAMERCRKACGREGGPTAAMMDTQVAKAAEKDAVGYDAGKKSAKRDALSTPATQQLEATLLVGAFDDFQIGGQPDELLARLGPA